MTTQDAIRILQRIAVALEQQIPQPPEPLNIKAADAFLWDAANKTLLPVPEVSHVPLPLLQGIDTARDRLLANTRQFAKGYSANNALLWGARGMGKSSLIKAVHAEINREMPGSVALVEIHREDIHSLPELMNGLRGWVIRRFILFCDDLTFDGADASYKSLKAALEGGIEGRPDHVLFYATSNRRHLMPREMIDNERSTAIQPGEAIEEKVSLSDRFGLWLGFHACSQEDYLAMVDAYASRGKLGLETAELHRQALEWSIARGSRSGRVAWQFVQQLAGELGKRINI